MLPAPRTDPGVRLSRTGLLPEVGRDQGTRIPPRVADPPVGDGHGMLCPVLRPGHRQSPAVPPTEPPSLHALRRRCSRVCSGASSVLRGSSDPSPVPRQRRLLAFLPRPGIASATAGQARSPRFRRCLFARDGVFDLGGATASRITTPHMLPSTFSNASAPAIFLLSRLNSPPHAIVVYASHPPSPTTTQHSLPGVRYDLPGPDFHRLDDASFLAHRESKETQENPNVQNPGFRGGPEARRRCAKEIQTWPGRRPIEPTIYKSAVTFTAQARNLGRPSAPRSFAAG